MKRREFVARIGTAALVWPLAARAQRTIPFIGFLNTGSPNERTHLVEAFRQGLKEGGYIDGKDVAIEYPCAEVHYYRFPSLASGLVRSHGGLIAPTGGSEPALAGRVSSAH